MVQTKGHGLKCEIMEQLNILFGFYQSYSYILYINCALWKETRELIHKIYTHIESYGPDTTAPNYMKISECKTAIKNHKKQKITSKPVFETTNADIVKFLKITIDHKD
jgi:hypothetical protein